ncbi:MAG: acetylglutamate kinase [Chloroflexi bacterium]|nr:acetylglutamate kinase [Chloroflexota bacterium]
MNSKLNQAIVVKIGGSTLGSHDTTLEDIAFLQKQGKPVIIVHGGGKLITEWLEKYGVASKFVQGERVTDAESLKVVIAVLAGLVNKDIVATINSMGGDAIGISGVDGALVQGQVKNKELGFVGEVKMVDTALLEMLVGSGYVPVIAPVSAALPGTGTLILNINADVVAGEIAAAIGAEKLIFLTDVAGVCDASGKLLAKLMPEEVESLIASGVVSGGMIPKIRACLRASSVTSTTRIIDGRQLHALLLEMEGRCPGTTIQAVLR